MPLPKSAELFFGIPLTDEQRVYADTIYDKLVTFVNARAGSGKTTVAVGVAKIIGKPLHYIFPTVEEKALGYTTGDVRQKESKYLTPLYDALVAIGDDPMKAIISETNMKYGNAWVKPYSHNYMRGSNLKDVTVVIDEAQNLTKRELKRILTRIHDSCHVVIMGDVNQCDIDPKQSGFLPYLEHYRGQDFVGICELTKNFRGVISSHAEILC
jgi:phosphate starvation-inducible PhoH-like protein